MDNNRPNIPKKLPIFAAKKKVFTPNLGYKRIAPKDSQNNVEVKIEHDGNVPSTNQKQKKVKERSTTQIQSVFSNMSSTSQGRSGPSRVGLSSGFKSYSSHGTFNSSGAFVKTEANQSIEQMQMSENDRFDLDDPLENFHGPVRLPFSIKDKRVPAVKLETDLEYPFQKNIYPSFNELIAPESLINLQFYDSSFSVEPKVSKIDLTGNDTNDVSNSTKTINSLKTEYNGYMKTENDMDIEYSSPPIGKVQYYRSGRVVLSLNGKMYELIKANEEKHHKELFSLTSEVETNKPEKLVSLGTIPLRLKAVLDINTIIENFLLNEL